jgi:hypothetical protein
MAKVVYKDLVVSKLARGEWEFEQQLIGEFPTTRPTPTQSENDSLTSATPVLPMVKIWDLAPIDMSSFDPFEPPGRPVAPPTNVAPPTITPIGTLEVGQQLVVTNGTWNPPTGLTYTRQWWRGTPATPIVGQTAPTYIIAAADVGQMIGCTVNASADGVHNVPVNANPVGPATVARPTNTTAPVVSVQGGGNAIVGSTLTRTNGTWTGSPTYQTQWVRTGGVTIAGATGATYIVQPADDTFTIGVIINATNGGGSNQATSNYVGPVTPTADDPGDGESVQPTRQVRRR